VQDADPPIDYDSPYSRLPGNVVLARVKKNVEKSMTFKNKYHALEWKKLFETEHANAIISDGFWYIICSVFKNPSTMQKLFSIPASAVMAMTKGTTDEYGQPVTYEAYQEFLLDRIAANYVSFTILDDDELDAYQEMMNQTQQMNESASASQYMLHPMAAAKKQAGLPVAAASAKKRMEHMDMQ
jgi:Protein of unknown function